MDGLTDARVGSPADVFEESLTRAGGFASDEDGAGSAVANTTVVFGALQIKDIAEYLEQRGV